MAIHYALRIAQLACKQLSFDQLVAELAAGDAEYRTHLWYHNKNSTQQESGVVVLTFTRIIKSVVTGQAPVTLEWRNTPQEKKHKQKLKWSRIYHSWRKSCLRQKNTKSEIGSQPVVVVLTSESAYDVPSSCWYVHSSHYSRLKKTTTPLATKKRLPRTYCTWYLSLRIRTSDSSQLETRKEKNRTEKARKKREKSKKK